jgi:exonuclease VII large subunit
LRGSEAGVGTSATGLVTGARALLDGTQAAVLSARTAIDRDARETVRVAESTVRTAATGLEPDARELLEDTQASVAAALEDARATARRCRELSVKEVQNLRGSITLAAETAIRPFELGTGRALSEIRTRLDVVPRAASDEVARVRRQIAEDGDRSTDLARERVAGLREQVIEDVRRRLDGCLSAIAIVRERADAVHPRTVLAAGYAILRDSAGEPLTGVAAVRTADVVTAELRDGATDLLNSETCHRGDDRK